MAPFLSAPVREGDLLAGKYRVERVLGAGGMGIVVAARHIELEQLVAIKFVRDEAIGSEDAVQRFLREARAAVKLKSEHVARVLDVGKLESGAPYMVMEYLEGNDLGKILTDYGPSSVDAAADWILQACEAVAEAHAAGIVHRDLKPENLFLARTVGGGQKIKVLDFGVSKAMGGASGEMSGLTRTRAMLGSPLYMAPEQMRSSRDVDARADIWALGVVLFQLLTNRWPFEAETMPELCLKVVTEPPMALATIRPEVPVGIVGVIERCLEKDPAKRFANAAELASALEPFVQPASRVLAERARLAMGIGSRASSLPGQVARPVASSTLQSTPSRLTPATRPGSTPGAPARATPAPPPRFVTLDARRFRDARSVSGFDAEPFVRLDAGHLGSVGNRARRHARAAGPEALGRASRRRGDRGRCDRRRRGVLARGARSGHGRAVSARGPRGLWPPAVGRRFPCAQGARLARSGRKFCRAGSARVCECRRVGERPRVAERRASRLPGRPGNCRRARPRGAAAGGVRGGGSAGPSRQAGESRPRAARQAGVDGRRYPHDPLTGPGRG